MTPNELNHINTVKRYFNNYRVARTFLLFIFMFTAINIVMLIAGSGYYLLFSASIPFVLTDLGLYLCGMYPEDFYEGGYVGNEFYEPSVFYVLLAIAIVLTLLYLLAYVLSRKEKGKWLVFALVYFSIDTLAMLYYYGISLNMLPDIIFHALAIGSLAVGVKAYVKLAHLNATETVSQGTDAPAVSTEEDNLYDVLNENRDNSIPDSTPLRPADFSAKSRTFLETEDYGHRIIYRRVKKTNELVIDGRVYGEYIALMERPHELSAYIDGHMFVVGINSYSKMFIEIDGKLVASKTRFW